MPSDVISSKEVSENTQSPNPTIDIEYYKIPVDLYREDDPIEADIYMYYQGHYIAYKAKGARWQRADEEKLKGFGLTELYVKFASRREHHRFLDERLSKLLDRPNVPLAQKAHVLYEIADPVLSTVYSTPSSSENIAAACGYVKNCIKYLNDRGALPELVELSKKTLTEHAHALHVATYTISLAKMTGYQSKDEVFALGMGALLHDIGKSKIDTDIVNKAGELNDIEWQLMRQHPQFGEEILDNRQLVPILSKRIVAEHHERVNGKGYPRGIKGIHVFSKMVGIADCFNALTSERTYSKAMSPFEALKFMLTTMKQEFDPQLLAAFIEMLSK